MSAQTGQVNKQTRRSQAARPACTHINMDRIYGGNQLCHMCGCASSTGYIYYCQQDADMMFAAASGSIVTSRHDVATYLNRKDLDGQCCEMPLVDQLAMIGMSKSVVRAAEAGLYTEKQLNILIMQKMEVHAMVQASIEGLVSSKSKDGVTFPNIAEKTQFVIKESLKVLDVPSQPDEKKAKIDANSKEQESPLSKLGLKKARTRQNAKPEPAVVSRTVQRCGFQVCHHCRPISRDRSFASFEAVLQGELEPPTMWIPELMPVIPCSIVQNLDEQIHDTSTTPRSLPVPLPAHRPLPPIPNNHCAPDISPLRNPFPYFPSLETLLEEEPPDSANTLESASSPPHHQPSTQNFHNTLVRDLRSIIEHDAAATAAGEESLTGFNPYTLQRLNALYVDGEGRGTEGEGDEVFDLDLWKAMADRVLVCAAETPLPEDDDKDLDQENPGEDLDSSEADEDVVFTVSGGEHLHEHDDTEEQEGTEEEPQHCLHQHLQVGVALTEEAVEYHIPDIITAV